MVEAYKLFWQNFFKLEGRSRRKDFWWPLLINTILTGIIGVIVYGITRLIPQSNIIYNISLAIINCIILIGTFTVAVRRFHDIGKTMILPCIFLVVSLYGLCVDYFSGDSNVYSSFEIHNQVLSVLLSIIAVLITLFIIVICIMSVVYCVKDSQKVQINMELILKANK